MQPSDLVTLETDRLLLTCAHSSNKRPQKTDAMRLEAAQELVASMVRQGILPVDQQDGASEDIAKATRWEQDDGYKIAKELEDRHHWDCDMQIAEAMEEFSSILKRIYDAAEEQWAAENPHEPEHSAGAAVTWRGKPAVIAGVYKHRPQCYKVRQGEMRANAYYVVPFEDVTP